MITILFIQAIYKTYNIDKKPNLEKKTKQRPFVMDLQLLSSYKRYMSRKAFSKFVLYLVYYFINKFVLKLTIIIGKQRAVKEIST